MFTHTSVISGQKKMGKEAIAKIKPKATNTAESLKTQANLLCTFDFN